MEDQSEEPVYVYIRIRPEHFTPENSGKHAFSPDTSAAAWSSFSPQTLTVSTHSLTSDSKCVAASDDKTLRVIAPDGAYASRKSVSAIDDKFYTFDRVFPEEASQEDIYISVSSLVKATVRGYNTTVFAYGCTGSGKSFTMTGNASAPGVSSSFLSSNLIDLDLGHSQSNFGNIFDY